MPIEPSPSLSRIARVDLDLSFRTRGEAALVYLAYHSRLVAHFAFRGGALFIGAGLAAALMIPILPGLFALLGFAALGVAAAAKTLSVLTGIPARTIRTLRLRGWSVVDRPDSARTRVRGRIMALGTVPTLEGRPAVFVRLRATRRGRGAEIHRGQSFLLDDGTGAPARVEVAHALLLDRPARMFGSWISTPLEAFALLPAAPIPPDLEEAALFPGEEVEVIGRLETVVDPSVSDRLARATPMIRVLSGTPSEPLLLRSRM